MVQSNPPSRTQLAEVLTTAEAATVISHDELDGRAQGNKLIDAWLSRKPAHFFEAE
jgi:hypothetical protein